jgi:predicted deacylase
VPVAARGAGGNAFTVGTATATEGHAATGTIDVPAGVDPALHIPVALFHGAWPGPVMALVSGAHGTEYASIIALEKVIARIDPTELSGTLIVVPLVNILLRAEGPPREPGGREEYERFYPGRADGTQTERASYAITREVVERCDYLIDLHGGDLDESLRPYSYWAKTGNEKQDAVSCGMVLAFGLDHIIIASTARDPNASRYLETTAATRCVVDHGRSRLRGDRETGTWRRSSAVLQRVASPEDAAGTAAPVEHPVWIERV